MKKFFYSLISLLCVALTASAQESVWVVNEDDVLTVTADQISSPYTDPGEGSIEGMVDGDAGTFWHSNWHSGTVANGTHYFEVNYPDLPEHFGFGFTRRNVINNHITKWSVYGAPSTDAAKTACTLLATVETPWSSNTESLTSSAIDSKGFTLIRFYNEETAGNNQYNQGYFHVAEFWLLGCKEITAAEFAKSDLGTTYRTYRDLKDNYTPGTNPGNYGVDEYKALEDALDAAADALDSEETYTAEQYNAMKDAIVSAFEALEASFVSFRPADGYYRILTAYPYRQTDTTEDTEDPETGEIISGETITTYPTKGMWAKDTNLRWGTVAEDAYAAAFVWKLTYNEETGNYQVQNLGTDGRFNQIVQSTAATLSTEITAEESEIAFGKYNTPEDGITRFSFRRADQNEAQYIYLHQGGHGMTDQVGTGKEGAIVGWASDVDASMWKLEAVTDEEAAALAEAYEPIRNHDLLVTNYKEILADAKAKLELATDVISEALITSTSQCEFHVTETSEGSEAAIIDGNPDTFWHSTWSTDPEGWPYITVELTDPIESFIWSITRRKNNGNIVNLMNVYGSNDGTDFTLVQEDFAIENATSGASWETTIELGAPYKYVKFEFTGTASSNCSIEGTCYVHFAEFQMYTIPADNPNSQFVQMGEVGETLQTVINEQSGLTDADLTIEDYNTLKEAYDAFIALFVDPTPLREALAANRDAAEGIVIGTNPGEWSDTSSAADFQTVYDAATAYDKAGKYTQGESDNYVVEINEKAAAIKDAANKVQEGKWYAIRFDSEDNYTEHKWNKTGAINETLGNLFDCVAAPANVVDDALEGASDISAGQAVRFINDIDCYNKDDMAFQFISVGDTAYVIKHSSGLYLQAPGAVAEAIQLSLKPAIFNVTAVGYGKNVIRIRTLDGTDLNLGGTPSYLHAQNSGHALVGWANDAVNSSSALLIQEIELTGDAVAAQLTANPNGIRIWTLPISYSIEALDGGIYELQGKKIDEGSIVNLCFNQVEKAEAGVPYLIVMGDYENESDEDENTEVLGFTTYPEDGLAPEAGSRNGMIGVYEYTWPFKDDSRSEDDDMVVVIPRSHYANYFGYKLATAASAEYEIAGEGTYFDENGFESRDVTAYTGYIHLGQTPVVTGDFDLELMVEGADEFTDIQSVVKNLNTTGRIYTADGRYVGNGNLSTVRNMGRGIYIVNGVKIAVK